jgi:Spy/CpxP family protein refolding chaperone
MRTALAGSLFAACASLSVLAVDIAPQAPGATAMEAVRQAAAADKKGLVEKNMQLTPEEAQKFWPIYDGYQRDLDRIVQRQNRAVLDYVNAESSMTDGNARRIAKEFLAADAEEQKLRERTARKLLQAVPPRKAVRYLQIENKLRTFYRYDIAERIPLVR